jgi:hypothetical protein
VQHHLLDQDFSFFSSTMIEINSVMHVVFYKTKEGERWFLISLRFAPHPDKLENDLCDCDRGPRQLPGSLVPESDLKIYI